jgi:phosphoadenosine phosphosulfate reductase
METLQRLEIPSPECLQIISDSLENKTPEEVLEWAVQEYRPHILMATAFGAEGCAIMEMLSKIAPKGDSIRYINLDTGYQFPETLELRERILDKYGIEVQYVRATESVEEMERRFGGTLYNTNPDECCRIRKVEPLRDFVHGFDAWISAIRRDQTHSRAKAGIVEWDPKFQLVKVNPLANWTKRELWQYLLDNDVPYNPLHDQGYPSIGCWPCTRATRTGEDDRSGRWSGSAKIECGLHTR